MKKLIALALVTLMVMMSAAVAENGLMTGGWTSSASPEITEDLQTLFDQGLEGLIGVKYTPVAYLGSQVVAGVNHCFLAQATAVVPDAQPYYALVYLYQDLQGQVTILSIADFDFGALCQYGEE